MPIPTAIPPPRPEPVREVCYQTLLSRIIDGTYPAGTRLDDDVLAAEFGLSRGPLREALNGLASFHMVEILPRRATIVSAIDQRSLREATTVLYVLVADAMRLTVGRLTAADRAALVAYRDTALTSDAVVRQTVRCCRVWTDFYAVIVNRLGNPEYDRVIRWIGPYARRFNWQIADLIDPTTEAAFELAEIEALLAGDVDALMTIWHEHTAVYIPGLVDGVQDHGGPLEPEVTGDTCAGRATAQIREAIADGTLLPGETLVEADLIAWLGVSRTPVRDALRRLSRQALVELEPGRPTRVAVIEEADLRNLADVAHVLRRTVAQLALRDRPEHLAAQLREGLADVTAAAPGMATTLAVGDLFHRLDTALGRGVYGQILEPIHVRGRFFAVRHPEAASDMTLDLAQQLVDAVETRDAGALDEALHRYFSFGGERRSVGRGRRDRAA
ncbi:GntR family transcriptional regulator [Cellulomonas rhizosphaerae]|uniref:GntR family transcriptional regulator n=1 Tax=Cellulomonas rhizosphaerae TaxID=2293719 RepID=A0A413RJ96_9CELL|nr:GntR family transcriptional regulator [Cellulomonas rhizosphaerae]RHA38582.1 GntR family transcriptional regulator [Cellulomonas rhizosphaerae]